MVSKRGTPLKSGYLFAIGLSSVKMVADRHRYAAYHNKTFKELFSMLTLMTLNDLET